MSEYIILELCKKDAEASASPLNHHYDPLEVCGDI